MKKLLVVSIAVLAVGVLAAAGFAFLGPDGALAQDSDEPDVAVEHHFGPLDDVLNDLVDEGVLEADQADAVRRRMAERMPAIEDGFHFRMKGFGDLLPEGFEPPPGLPGTPEFEEWLDGMRESLGDDFFGGHMFRFDGDLPDGEFFHHGPGRMGPGMMGDGFPEFHGFGDFNFDDLQGFMDDMVERFGGELPEHMQDMLDRLQDELSGVDGAETSLDA
jgi:hypothetical protein